MEHSNDSHKETKDKIIEES